MSARLPFAHEPWTEAHKRLALELLVAASGSLEARQLDKPSHTTAKLLAEIEAAMPRSVSRDPSEASISAPQCALLEAERDELKRDRDALLRTLTKVQYRLEQMPAILLSVNAALRGE